MQRKIGIAMFTVRQSAERDLSGTLQSLSALGYTGIEFYGAPVWPLQEIRAALQNSGMALTGYHTEYRDLQENTRQKTAEFLNEIGCPLAVVPYLGGCWHVGHTEAEENLATWQRHIAWLQETEEYLKACGIRTGYHNHEHEFSLQYGEKPCLTTFSGPCPRSLWSSTAARASRAAVIRSPCCKNTAAPRSSCT